MSPNERRQELLETLCRRRKDTYDNLAHEFGVSKRTIRYDIEILSCSYPIEHQCFPGQVALLKKLGAQLQGEDLATLNSIISDFAPF